MVRVRRNDDTIDIENLDDLYRVVKEVRTDDEPLILVINGVEETISPAPKRQRRQRQITEEDYEATMSTFGAWKGLVDTDQMKQELYAARGSRRRTVDL
ncbi:MAG: hypothetical protein ACRDJW_19945 [Thermomicrobiales bacterium]